jgi:alpha-galactosidase/6-phospho-beta-glucosidase family protein
MSSPKPKVVIIGAGSLFFGQKAIWAMNRLDGLKGGTLALVDNDSDNLRRMDKLARMVAEHTQSGTVVESWSDYRDALPGADFVILSFAQRNAWYRKIDCEISAKYGIRMCSGDTIGPGGVFRTMRDFPKILEVARTVETVCPDAWLINYINPSAIMGIGLMRHSKAKSFALCDTHHMPYKKLSYLKMIGEEEAALSELDMRIAGVNHFTWMLKAELRGKDILPSIRDAFHQLSLSEKDQGHAKARFNNFITAQLTDLFGAIPTCTGHTKEYLPYYQGRAAIQEKIPALSIFDSDERMEYTASVWQRIDGYLNGSIPLQEFIDLETSDHATDIIQTMVTGDGRNYFINRTNSDCIQGGGKAIGNLPEDAFLELECQLDANGPRPLPVGDFPLGLRALQMQILDIHELTIEAIMRKDRDLLVRALAMDPLVNSIATAKAVIDDLYIAEQDVLPDWVAPKATRQTQKTVHVGAAPQLY